MTTTLGLLLMLASAPTPGETLLQHASALEGIEYDLGGRLQAGRGIDCQGIIFFALERMGRCDWRSWSVMPTKTLARGELGAPVTPRPMLSTAIDTQKLRPGDVLYFLAPTENPREDPSFTVDIAGTPTKLWVWHMGIYAGGGRALHADPFRAGKVAKQPLDVVMNNGFAAVFATRVTASTKPAKCRRGAKMRAPPSATPWEKASKAKARRRPKSKR